MNNTTTATAEVGLIRHLGEFWLAFAAIATVIVGDALTTKFGGNSWEFLPLAIIFAIGWLAMLFYDPDNEESSR